MADERDPFDLPQGTAGQLAFMSQKTFQQIWDNERAFALMPKHDELTPKRGDVILFLESDLSWEDQQDKQPKPEESMKSATGRAMRTRVAGVVESVPGMLPDWLAVSFDAVENIEGVLLMDPESTTGALVVGPKDDQGSVGKVLP